MAQYEYRAGKGFMYLSAPTEWGIGVLRLDQSLSTEPGRVAPNLVRGEVAALTPTGQQVSLCSAFVRITPGTTKCPAPSKSTGSRRPLGPPSRPRP